MESREVLAALRSGWWLTLLGLIIGGATAALVSVLQTPVYTSSTQLFVSTRDSASSAEFFQGSQFSQARVTSYARLLSGEELAGRVVDRLDLDASPEELSEQITATAVTDTVLIDVSVTDTSPERAQRIAEVVGQEFTAFVTELETPDGTGASPVTVTVTDRPEVPRGPSAPHILTNVALGLLAGLAIGAGLAVLRVRLDRSVKDPDAVATAAGAPVIGTVLQDESLAKRHTFEGAGGTRTAEDYRLLRTNLQFLDIDRPPKVVMVSSPLPAEGKTTLVINLALALAEAGQRVIVVEADLRRPKVASYLGMVEGAGLTNVLAGQAELEDVQQVYRERMSVLAAGPLPPNPGQILASSHMADLLDELRQRSDFVLVDAPPLLPVADSAGLATAVDGVILSVRHGTTRTDQLEQAALVLGRVSARLLGVVLNIVPPKAGMVAKQGYAYGYAPAEGSPKHRDRLPPEVPISP